NDRTMKFIVRTGKKVLGVHPVIEQPAAQNLVRILFPSHGREYAERFGQSGTKHLWSGAYAASIECIMSLCAGVAASTIVMSQDGYAAIILHELGLMRELYHLLRSHGVGAGYIASIEHAYCRPTSAIYFSHHGDLELLMGELPSTQRGAFNT